MFPTLSVTAIGLVFGGIGLALSRDGWAPLLAGVVGAWVGFGLGAVIGVIFDIVVGTGTGVALAGHALAIVGAFAAVRSRNLGKGWPHQRLVGFCQRKCQLEDAVALVVPVG